MKLDQLTTAFQDLSSLPVPERLRVVGCYVWARFPQEPARLLVVLGPAAPTFPKLQALSSKNLGRYVLFKVPEARIAREPQLTTVGAEVEFEGRVRIRIDLEQAA